MFMSTRVVKWKAFTVVSRAKCIRASYIYTRAGELRILEI